MKRRWWLMILLMAVLMPIYAQKGDKGTPAPQEQGVVVLLKNKTLQVQNVKSGDKLEILNILGVRVLEKKIEGTDVELQLNLPQGYYIVKVASTVRKISVK
ncbi:MAG: T9SS type A sorting domain-containing protein [Bacteroidota bacterium]|nr:T9SS type A sorting domain-containing protein [Bacteroidota bacterium]